MKVRWILGIGLAVLALVRLALGLLLRDTAQTALDQTRRELRRQGFKIDLKEFDFSVPAEFTARDAALTNADLWVPTHTTGPYYYWNTLLAQPGLNLMAAAGSDAAIIVWKQEKLPPQPDPYLRTAGDQPVEDLWTALHDTLGESRSTLGAACDAALAGPIRFSLDASRGSAMLLPHLARLKSLAQMLGIRAVQELHDGNQDAAWTNLLASARLVTAWNPEPAEMSHMVRYAYAAIVYNTTWQALQAGGWTDDRLAQLQHEWEAADFFKGLPDTEAFARACHVRTCQLERQQPLLDASLFLQELRQSPMSALHGLIYTWRQLGYRHHGSYEDENALLLYHRDRELELRRAVQARTWLEMRQCPGVTNPVPFQTKYPSRSRVSAMITMRQFSLGFVRQGQRLLGRAAEAEAHRRLIITALALERYRCRHGSYPQTLRELVPELLNQPPIDFMDAQPLRYRLTGDGHFVMYSVGLDCADNGGEMRRPGRRMPRYEAPPNVAFPQGPDLVWPRPASAAEVQAQKQEEQRQAELERAAADEREAEAQKEAETERQAAIEKLLAEAEARKAAPLSSRETSPDPIYQGRPLSQLLRNATTTGTNRLTLEELLTARQIITGQAADAVAFEVPINYDAATNLGRIHLVVDGGLDVGSRGEEGERQTCERATNGNCLLGWTTTYDPPGKHVIQAEFIATKNEEKEEEALKVMGPPVLFVSTNICQFSVAYEGFDNGGATLYAKLPESNAVFTIELKTPEGIHIKTLTGTTSNGVIKVHWDLIDDQGRRYTKDAFDSVFDVTLPGSGRSQTLKGP